MSLNNILSGLEPNPASYASASAEIENMSCSLLHSARIGILSSFTSNHLKPYLVVEAARRGIFADIFFGPYGQFEQQILVPDSSLCDFNPDVLVIAALLEDFSPLLTEGFLSLDQISVQSEIDSVCCRMKGMLESFRGQGTAKLLVFNFTLPGAPAAGLADPMLRSSQTEAVASLNSRLAKICASVSECYVFDYEHLVRDIGREKMSDNKLQFLARIPFSAEAQKKVSERLSRYIHALFNPPRKCLVLDMDNTLWGGIVAEDGLGGIHLGEDYPGNIYKSFQKYLLTLRARGVLLTAASKNDEKDALAVLEGQNAALAG